VLADDARLTVRPDELGLGVEATFMAASRPPLRVLVETGYDRTINPGQPTPANLLYFPNPVATTKNFLVAIPTGWDNGIATITNDPANRPFHTEPQGTYGVGGPPVDTGAIDPYGDPTPYAAPNTTVPQQDSTPAVTAVEQQAPSPLAGAQHGTTTPQVTRPNRPTTRVGLAFEPKRLTTARPAGERPLRTLLDRLTGKSEADTPAPSSEDAAA